MRFQGSINRFQGSKSLSIMKAELQIKKIHSENWKNLLIHIQHMESSKGYHVPQHIKLFFKWVGDTWPLQQLGVLLKV